MKEVFQELYHKYHHDVFQFLFYMVKDRSLAEDLVQEVYVKVLKSYDKFKGESTEKTWLFSIARHVAIDHFRKQKRKRKRIADSFDWQENGDMFRDEGKLPDEITIQNEDVKHMYNCLNKCTIDQQSVLILRYIQSLSIQETADILDWSVSKVKTTQHRAMKALKDFMLENGEGMESEAK
ncbi:RNA polymerase sigma-70 factor (ECF subfamily) [Salirhabdus euzebyi]|uniref:RNA polymerase sigma factor n=1 Tax=Salirhabdus euzebyi TaxID=394506 RepID=A0A841QA25_9BACI|nr:RNA polymerase sigma factor SigX [Salirhabdus euzebyi]MBB6455278.1 RNA polymerase sigma-70 factor (ECF subfamily) [Salirhabdus euzebyi]